MRKKFNLFDILQICFYKSLQIKFLFNNNYQLKFLSKRFRCNKAPVYGYKN